MNRLINADELKDTFTNRYDGQLYCLDYTSINKVIDEAPTVEAIPVKYIKKWAKHCDAVGEYYTSNVIDRMIEEWKEKNEVD